MFKKLLLKLAPLLQRTHVYINNRYKKRSTFVPYQLTYTPSANALKIIHINGNFIVGGSTQLIVDLIERTSDAYVHQIVVPGFSKPLPYQPVDIKNFSLYDLEKLSAFLEEQKPALVHIHYWIRHHDRHSGNALWYGAIFKICEELNIKVIQNINVPTEPYRSPAVVHNVFVSEYVRKTFNAGNSSPARVIYPGSDFAHFKNDRVDTLPANAVGMVYRLDRDKLNAEAIEVFITAVRRKPDLHCYIIGGGHFLECYQHRVQEEGVEQNFTFTGMVTYRELPAWYRKFGIFVAPVHDESFGQVTPFAMSMGLCVAGYDTGALQEILGTSETLVPYGRIEDLATVLANLVNDPARRIELGMCNQARAHRMFSVETMIASYRALYAEHMA